MTETSQYINNTLKVSLVLEGLKYQGDKTKSIRVTQDFVRLKGKMTLALIGTVVSYLEKDNDNLRDVFITSPIYAVSWLDRLLGAFIILSP